MNIKTFWVEQLPIYDWVYSASSKGPCPVHGEYHQAESAPIERRKDEDSPGWSAAPKNCACGAPFTSDDLHGRGSPRYRRLDNGEEIRGKLPPGALYVAGGLGDEKDYYKGMRGADGLCVVCVLPDPTGTHWYIDSQATNCTRKDDETHRCWVRHGTVGGTIHVDKNGDTCQAGAGSIAVPGYHGFLHNGELRSC